MMSPKVWESLPSPPSFPFLLSFLFSFLPPLEKRRHLLSYLILLFLSALCSIGVIHMLALAFGSLSAESIEN